MDSISVQLLNVDPLARPAGSTCWISLCLAGFLCRPVARDALGVALQNHTPIERPAQGLSFGAGLDSLRPQLLIPEPLARPTGWTCWISLCLAGLVLRSPNSRTVGAGLHNHTPIERPAQGLSFGAGLDSLRVQLLILDPLARPTGWT